jgi:hypothetical protein
MSFRKEIAWTSGEPLGFAEHFETRDYSRDSCERFLGSARFRVRVLSPGPGTTDGAQRRPMTPFSDPFGQGMPWLTVQIRLRVWWQLKRLVAAVCQRSLAPPVGRPELASRDHPRLSCGAGDSQLGSALGDIRRLQNQRPHCSLCAGLSTQRERVCVATDAEPDRLAPLPRQRRWASAGFRWWRRAVRRHG